MQLPGCHSPDGVDPERLCFSPARGGGGGHSLQTQQLSRAISNLPPPHAHGPPGCSAGQKLAPGCSCSSHLNLNPRLLRLICLIPKVSCLSDLVSVVLDETWPNSNSRAYCAQRRWWSCGLLCVALLSPSITGRS